jgi:DNA-binding CsgD family transcriptional regulator
MPASLNLKHTKRTIEMYRKKLLDKLGLTSTADLIIWAVKKAIYKV